MASRNGHLPELLSFVSVKRLTPLPSIVFTVRNLLKLSLLDGGVCQTATRFNIPHFDNPFYGYYQLDTI